MKLYLYGMKLRGFSIGCQPRAVIDRRDDPAGIYHDIIGYEHKLTKEEAEKYDLVYLGEETK